MDRNPEFLGNFFIRQSLLLLQQKNCPAQGRQFRKQAFELPLRIQALV